MATAKQNPDVETARTIASLAYGGDALEILVLIEAMETQNSGEVNETLSDAGAAQAGIVIRNSMIAWLVILVARAYAKARPGDLHLQRGFDLLKDIPVRTEFDGMRLGAAIAEAERYWSKCTGDHRLPHLLHFRDKFTAHIGKPKDVPIPVYKDLFAVARATVTAMEKFARATGVADVPVREQIDAKPAAEAFWRPWQKMPRAI
jgi:hypothetical protein